MKSHSIVRFLGIITLLISFTTVHGQITNEKYRTESIYFQGHSYVKNGVKYPITSWGKNLKREMEVSPEAMTEYQKFQKQARTALILSSLGLVSLVTSVYVDNDDLRNGFLVGSLGLLVVSIPINHKAGNSFQKAVWLRNGAILN